MDGPASDGGMPVPGGEGGGDVCLAPQPPSNHGGGEQRGFKIGYMFKAKTVRRMKPLMFFALG